MNELISLVNNYSTTRLVTHEPPILKTHPDDTFQTLLSLPISEGRQGEGGLRPQGYFKRSLPDKPLITVITVVYNGAAHLEETIQSVIGQTYDNVEYIIIDGGSTDGTLDIIRRYEHAIDYWVSEKDEGIYDAMNKGLYLASQDSWILILGSDDTLQAIDVEILETIKFNNSIKNIITDVAQLNLSNNKKTPYLCWLPSKNLESDFLKFPIHHQGFITKKERNMDLYKPSYGIHADLYFMLSRIEKNKTKKINAIMTLYRTGGESDKYSFSNIKSLIRIAKALDLKIINLIKNNPICAVKMVIKSITPYTIIEKTRKNFSIKNNRIS